MNFNSIRLVRQQLLETASCPFRPEGYRDKSMQNRTFGVVQRLGGTRMSQIVPFLRGDGTKAAPTRDLFDQPPGEMS